MSSVYECESWTTVKELNQNGRDSERHLYHGLSHSQGRGSNCILHFWLVIDICKGTSVPETVKLERHQCD